MKKIKACLPVIDIFLGLILLLYPWISEYIYHRQTASLIETFAAEMNQVDTTEKDLQLAAAQQYNENLLRSVTTLTDPFQSTTAFDSWSDYSSILSFDAFGLMGTIEIPSIDVNLPIYHGTTAEILAKGIGHLEGSSFPIGGISTHAVLSGHTGLTSKKLFTDLTELQKDDLFFIHVLGDTLAYRVCSINVVEPSDSSLLQIQQGRDLVTLITCTPYGVNSHRLLVTGERTDYVAEQYQEALLQSVSADSQWMQPYRKAILIGLLISVGISLICIIVRWKRRRMP